MPDTIRTSRAPTDIDLQVGERVRQLRQAAGLTLAEFAAELGISHQQLQKYEFGANRFSAGMLYSVALVLRVEIGDLFPGGSDAGSEGREAIRTLKRVKAALEEKG